MFIYNGKCSPFYFLQRHADYACLTLCSSKTDFVKAFHTTYHRFRLNWDHSILQKIDFSLYSRGPHRTWPLFILTCYLKVWRGSGASSVWPVKNWNMSVHAQFYSGQYVCNIYSWYILKFSIMHRLTYYVQVGLPLKKMQINYNMDAT